MDDETRARFEEAVERKKEESRQRSEQHTRTGSVPPGGSPAGVDGDQHSLVSDDRKTQDVYSVRDKNSGKGKKTADKWNQ
jgi:hypothetical protein